MERVEMLESILDSYPYCILFVDCDHIIRYMNKEAEFRYYDVLGYRNLIGTSFFDCHREESREKIMEMVEDLKLHGNEKFLGMSPKNERRYLTPVRDENGELIGYFQRFEINLQTVRHFMGG